MKFKRTVILLILTGFFYGFHSFLQSKTCILNRGVSFGWDLTSFWFLALIWGFLLVYWMTIFKKSVGLMLMISGGCVNLIDRIRYGGVCDYWKIWGINIYNNIADWLIFIGVVLLIINLIWKKK